MYIIIYIMFAIDCKDGEGGCLWHNHTNVQHYSQAVYGATIRMYNSQAVYGATTIMYNSQAVYGGTIRMYNSQAVYGATTRMYKSQSSHVD